MARLQMSRIIIHIQGRAYTHFVIMVAIGAEAFIGIVRSNKTAAFIVDPLKEETTEEAIVDAMCQKYDAPREAIAVDGKEILDTLRQINALEE